jgi:hypothetical protein
MELVVITFIVIGVVSVDRYGVVVSGGVTVPNERVLQVVNGITEAPADGEVVSIAPHRLGDPPSFPLTKVVTEPPNSIQMLF